MELTMNKKNKVVECIVIFSSLLYIIDIFLISNLGQDLNLRVQDIASILSIFTFAYVTGEYKRNKKNFFYIILSIIIFLTYVIISNLIFYAKGNINNMFIFYVGKEMEFFLCMFNIAYFSKNYNKGFYRLLNILIVVNIIYGFYQVITANISYYGIGAICGKEPSISGMIYFACSIISFFMYKMHYRKKFKIYALLTYILTIFTISKTSILGLTVFYVLFFILDILYSSSKTIKNKQQRNSISLEKTLFFIIILILLIILTIIFLNSTMINKILKNELVQRIFNRFKVFNNSYSFRKNKAKFYYDYFIGNSIVSMFFGCGKGVTEFVFNSKVLAVDNQFIRGIIELGLIGITIWLSVIFSVINLIRRSNQHINYCLIISLFVAYLCMGIGYEVFVVTKAGSIFWFLVGAFLSESV